MDFPFVIAAHHTLLPQSQPFQPTAIASISTRAPPTRPAA